MFEIQIKYNTGWETVASIHSWVAAQMTWGAAGRRWPSFKQRLVVDGKPWKWRG
jgi:hypothetical protein